MSQNPDWWYETDSDADSDSDSDEVSEAGEKSEIEDDESVHDTVSNMPVPENKYKNFMFHSSQPSVTLNSLKDPNIFYSCLHYDKSKNGPYMIHGICRLVVGMTINEFQDFIGTPTVYYMDIPWSEFDSLMKDCGDFSEENQINTTTGVAVVIYNQLVDLVVRGKPLSDDYIPILESLSTEDRIKIYLWVDNDPELRSYIIEQQKPGGLITDNWAKAIRFAHPDILPFDLMFEMVATIVEQGWRTPTYMEQNPDYKLVRHYEYVPGDSRFSTPGYYQMRIERVMEESKQ